MILPMAALLCSQIIIRECLVEGNNISLVIVSASMNDIKSLFSKLKEGGSVGMDLQETFWSKCYGSLTDKFGIHWQLSHDSGQRM